MTPNQFAYHCHMANRTLPHGERPTRLHVRVARVLARWQHHSPSHAKLARASGCCVRTVQNALNRFRALGMLGWTHQGTVLRSGRRLRLPNAYRLMASFCLFRPPAHKKVIRVQDPELLLGKLAKEALLVKWGLKKGPALTGRTGR